MKAIKFPEQNSTLGAGGNRRTEDLPICRTHQNQPAGGDEIIEVPVVVSKWKLTEEELKEVNETGCVYLVVIGVTHPPLYLVGESPFN